MLSQVLTQLAAADPNPTPAPWRVITMVVYFVGLFGTFGGSLAYVLVVGPVLARPSVAPADRDVLRRRAALTLAAIGTWFLIGLYLQLAGKAARVKGEEIPFSEAVLPPKLLAYLMKPAQPGEWMSIGAQTTVQYATWAVSAALLILLWSSRLHPRTGRVAGAAYVVAFLAYAVTWLPTDPTAETFDSVLDGVMNHVHVLAVSTWVGGIATLALLAAVHRRLTPHAGVVWGQIWSRYSVVALTAVGCMVVSGSWLAWKYVGSIGDLVTTEFGRLLLVKVSLVSTMVAIGGVNEFLLMPRIARARAAGADDSVFRLAVRVFPRLVAVESILGVGVLFVLAFLTGSARAETGSETPVVDGGVITVGLVLIAAVAISLVTTAKISDRLIGGPTAATTADLAGS
ncbi:copper resistance D family protein [Pseudonocardia alaniniphila]|uniref:CopD family protein n=1 Tax=Pseudonocardia alaniniphila TaxID=75291 RepID=A0ABS9TRH1_9PSEU|nr:CopD family protein [Pseudonocardia alaniniphila]MCH6171153.1 CopD family protein [Pseudonocardia alaniniphila]